MFLIWINEIRHEPCASKNVSDNVSHKISMEHHAAFG
ncbi:hypothetical protein EDF78_108187 [Rahnella sp. BIGb0236]|nr:hypothetical protein EDF78_108187 [Rahnella sp. BIGb0236]